MSILTEAGLEVSFNNPWETAGIWVKGGFHIHTTASDGTTDAETMAQAAADAGYEYLAITDHSKSSAVAGGLSIDRMWRQIEAVRRLNEDLDTITLLVGCECDILADGSLDYPDDILAECDWVVASIHSAMTGGKVSPTERTIRAMANPHVCAIGHPTGRLIGTRPPMEIDMAAVVAAAAETGTALEINASWQRLDLNDLHIRQALAAGVMLTINTDAHSAKGLGTIGDGIITARRGAAPPSRVLNTFTPAQLRRWIDSKRGQ